MMTRTTKNRPSALVTGASSGIGAAFAERLAHDGYDLTIVARRRDKLETLAEQLQQKYLVSVEVIAADLSQPEDLQKVENRLEEDSALELLVNNAGFGGYMAFIELDPAKATELINLKVLAVTRLTRAALPGMIARERGSIVNVSSRLAFSGSMGSSQLPKRATYAGVNAFINTFTQLLQSELEGTGVQVQGLCPGVVQTEFHERVGIDPSRYPTAIVMTPEEVVQASLAGLKLGEVICVPAMEDLSLLTQIQESEKRFFELTRSGKSAARYRS
jgi:short-subunit dehydrogenase